MPSRRSRTAALAALLAAAVLCPPAAAGAAPARGPVREAAEPGWTAEPAAGRATAPGSPDGRPYFYLEGVPGTVLEDAVALANPSGAARTLTLRGADAYNAAGGALAVRPAGGSAGAGGWIGFGAGATVRIPPHTRAVVPFTVTVPPGAVPGDHPAAVVVSEGAREAAVRVQLRVRGPVLAALTVEDVAVTGRGAATRIRYALVNRGNTALTPELGVTADGLLGDVAGRAAHRLGVELLPGQRVELSEPWPGAPVFDAVDLRLTVTAAGGARAEATASARFVPWAAVGWTGAGVLALAAVAAVAVLLVRTNRAGRGTDPHPPEQADRPGSAAELTGAVR
ncbi:hypothetical protein [Streptomyces sp. NPDC089919]|uniref:COG1470 family protein n=1 Tax=Streptomyces sp. NPDC089919 TaxID=3155188 RepID=UPI0034396558